MTDGGYEQQLGGELRSTPSGEEPKGRLELSPKGILAGTRIYPRDAVRHVRDAGWRDEKVHLMVAVGGAESSMYSEAVHANDDGTEDWGWLQLNSGHAGLTKELAFDPAQAAVFAYGLYKSSGYSFRPWVVWKTGAYKDWLPTALHGVENYWRMAYGWGPI
jgi:hypothetical protein